MKSMLEVVSDTALRPEVNREVVALIDREVDSKSGLGGMAIKTGYKIVKSLKGGRMIPDVVEGLLDEFVGAIEPIHARYREAPSGSFADFLKSNERDATNALLSITDGRAQRTTHGTLKKTYEKLRPVGEKNVSQALPALGALIDRFCA